MDDVVFLRDGRMARRVYSEATIEHDKLNSRDSNQMWFNYTDVK